MHTRRRQLEQLLKNPAFRGQFVGDYVHEMIATQVREIREKRPWTQAVLGDAADGMQQTQISRLEDPEYARVTVNSLLRIARAFDLALIVRLAPFSDFLDWVVTATPKTVAPDSYAEEQRRAALAAAPQTRSTTNDQIVDLFPPSAGPAQRPIVANLTGGVVDEIAV